MASRPAIIESLLRKHEYSEANDPGIHPCEGAKFHSPRPLAVHPCKISGRIVYLCGTCVDNLKSYLLIAKEEGQLSWEAQRCYGNQLRSIANIEIASKSKGT